MSTITKQDGYTFGRGCQEDIDSLGEACMKYYELVPPVFEARDFLDIRGAFIDTPIVEIPQDFERLVPLKENNSLHNVSLVHCRDPLFFGQLTQFRKQLGEISYEFITS